MLDELSVRNLAVLEEARIHPGPGLTVITGETGTGKTLLLGALQILAGGDLRKDRIGPFGDEAAVELRLIEDADSEVILSRRLQREGRTRSYINGGMAGAADLAERLQGAVEIVAQHDHLRIARRSELIRLLDGLLTEDGRRARAAYDAAWTEWADLLARSAKLGGDLRQLERDRDLALHETNEITAAAFTEEEVEGIHAELSRLRHAQDLIGLLDDVSRSVETASETLGGAVDAARRAARLTETLAALSERIDGLAIELSEAARDAADELESISLDPRELQRAEERLSAFSDLRRRYGDTVGEINEYGRLAAERVNDLTEVLDLASQLDAERARTSKNLEDAGSALHLERAKAAVRLCADAEQHLKDLGFAAPRVRVSFDPRTEPAAFGVYNPELNFASDASLQEGPLSQVASGGELSRLVLALRVAAGVGDAKVIAFDEIDAGVGGAVALKVGEKLAGLAKTSQVVCVSHLPQIAAFADTHYVVERLDGAARVRLLEGEARLSELTRMLSGIEATESGLSHAEELLAFAERQAR